MFTEQTTVCRLYVLAAALLFSTGGAAIKLSAMSSWQLASFRSGLAALVLWLLIPTWRRCWRPPSLAVGAAFAATLVLFVTANTLTTAASAVFLQYSAPLYVLLLGPLLLGESNRRGDLAVLSLIAAGMVLFFVGQEVPSRTAPDPLRGNVVALAAGVTWGLALLGMRWLDRDHAPAASGGAVVAGNAIACVLCLPWALPVVGATGFDWAVVGYLGVFQVGLSYVCLIRGVRQLRALEAALLLSIEPVASAVWAWLLHGELPGGAAAVGCVVIFVGVSVQTLRRS